MDFELWIMDFENFTIQNPTMDLGFGILDFGWIMDFDFEFSKIRWPVILN